MTPSQCQWSGHLWLPNLSWRGFDRCLRCNLLFDRALWKVWNRKP